MALAWLAVTTLLFQARDWVPAGADGFYISRLIEENAWPLYYRSVLTVLIHRWVYAAVSPLGFDGWGAMALGSSMAGGVAVLALWNLSRHPVFLAVNILSGSFLVFAGHSENYAWVNAFLLLHYLAVWRWIEGRAPLWAAALWFVLACLSHMLALFYVPAFAWLLWKRPAFNPLHLLFPLAAFTLVLAALPLGGALLGTDVGLERFVPLFSVWAPNQFFTFFSLEHLKMLLFFHHRAAFLGVPAELPLLVVLRKRIDSVFRQCLLAHTLCGLAWTTVWHPDWGYSDWDLFSQFAIPMHVLTGLILQPGGNRP